MKLRLWSLRTRSSALGMTVLISDYFLTQFLNLKLIDAAIKSVTNLV